jgi:hypothetical protein
MLKYLLHFSSYCILFSPFLTLQRKENKNYEVYKIENNYELIIENTTNGGHKLFCTVKKQVSITKARYT